MAMDVSRNEINSRGVEYCRLSLVGTFMEKVEAISLAV